MTSMRTLTIDIETAPNVGHLWSLWNQTIGLPQLIESGHVLCFAAKWYDQPDVTFHKGPGLVKAAHKLLNAADVVVGYNHVSFDIKWLQSEMVRKNLTPPAPWKDVDLLSVVRQRFRFPSNKLAYVARELLGEGKAETGGHETWIGCMANNPVAWAAMEAYNRHDVVITERLYDYLKPWIKNPPNPALYGDADVAPTTCPQCGSAAIKKAGIAYTQLSAYQRYQCTKCGRWSRGQRRHQGVDAR